MTNKELSAALRDLDAQIDEFVREHVVAELGESVSSLRITEVPDSCSGAGLMNALPRNGEQRGLTAAGNFPAPEPHEPTKVLGWLLVGFAGFCVYVLGATIFKFWPVIVRTLR
jgi:hypothetical protein